MVDQHASASDDVPRIFASWRAELIHPSAHGFDETEILATQARLSREYISLVEKHLRARPTKLCARAFSVIPEFRNVGLQHDLVECALFYTQKRDCGGLCPDDEPGAVARAIIQLGCVAQQLELGPFGAAGTKCREFLLPLDSFIEEIAAEIEAATAEQKIARKGRAHGQLEALYASLLEHRGDIGRYARWARVADPAAFDESRRVALSRAEAALECARLPSSIIADLIVDCATDYISSSRADARTSWKDCEEP